MKWARFSPTDSEGRSNNSEFIGTSHNSACITSPYHFKTFSTALKCSAVTVEISLHQTLIVLQNSARTINRQLSNHSILVTE